MNIFIAGAGVFGTAMANVIDNSHDITLYSRSASIVEDINTNRKNSKYFPNKTLSKKIWATNDLEKVKTADIIFLCIPSYTVLDFVKRIPIDPKTILINGAKGYANDTELIPTALHRIIKNDIVSIKGPSFATEMMYELPTAFTIATKSVDNYAIVSQLFRKGLIYTDHSEDVLGIELISILKNVYAIILGIVDATYNSANVRFLIFTKALKEIKSILEFLGHSSDILFNYAGIGDFGLTSLNDLSRNRTLGLLIGKGFLNAELGNSVTLEGVRSAEKISLLIPPDLMNDLTLISNLKELLHAKISNKAFIKNITSE